MGGFEQAYQDEATDDMRRDCEHEWEYDEDESAGPWTGYIERCKRCGALQQVPQ
jgi:hypothetical protein